MNEPFDMLLLNLAEKEHIRKILQVLNMWPMQKLLGKLTSFSNKQEGMEKALE